MPMLREGDTFLVDLVEADGAEMMREGCRAAEVWRVSELRGLDGVVHVLLGAKPCCALCAVCRLLCAVGGFINWEPSSFSGRCRWRSEGLGPADQAG